MKETELDNYKKGLTLLHEQKIKFKPAANLECKNEIFPEAKCISCGSITERLKGLEELKSKKYLSLKGGYGVQQCLAQLDLNLFKNCSVFGYSDLTALFLKLQVDQSIKLFHSPMLVELSNLSQAELESFLNFLQDEQVSKKKLLRLTPGLEKLLQSRKSLFLTEPSYIWGGNLTLLLSMNSKPEIKNGYKNILFIEDCFEEAYKIERMLYALESHNFLNDIDELWLGEPQEALFNIELLEAFAEKYNFNLITGLAFGHNQKFTLPIFHYYD